MARTLTKFGASLCLAALAAGCGSSPPSRYYTLESTAKAEGTPAATYVVAVGPVTIPAAVDRPQIVVQVAPNRVALDEFERWAAPLEENVARVVAGDLSILLGAPRVTTGNVANSGATYQVAVDVQRFDSIPGQAALIEAFWSVRNVATATTSSGRTVARESVAESGFDALAGAHSRALGHLSADIAAAIRADAAAKR
jgi:uncharacterized lipoprotein YmbA